VGAIRGKAPADTPALKPYWGKPAVRNFRGDDGNVGIMRSPVRAIVLPDRAVNDRNVPGFRVCVRTRSWKGTALAGMCLPSGTRL
jgi:hypothetical protein